MICAAFKKVSQEYAQKDIVTPLSVFWFDKTGEWQPVIDCLKKTFTTYIHGSYDEKTLSGPAIYIRTSIAKREESSHGIPIIYLPEYL